jgi:predicted nucleic acid-binding protein
MAAPRYLIDTNVVSELRKRRPNENVVRWISELPPDAAFLSVITIGEIAKGISKRRRSKAGAHEADELQSWMDGLIAIYADRILPVDVPVALRWGRLCDEHPQLATDMLIAATAIEAGLVVATRNVAHFTSAGVPAINPWE